MTAPELNDLSLLLLADLGAAHARTSKRIGTLLSTEPGTIGNSRRDIPRPLKALVAAGLCEVRRAGENYKVDITDKGMALHRAWMAALHNSNA